MLHNQNLLLLHLGMPLLVLVIVMHSLLSLANLRVQQLCSTLPSSSIATLADSGNVAGVAHSSPSWVIDSGANKHISGILSFFSDLLPIKHHIVFADGSS